MTADTISAQINRISNNIEMAYSALLDKGATMPATNNSALLADTINTISGGGGGGSDEVGKYMIDANGMAVPQAGDINGRFTGITSVANNAMANAFSYTAVTGEANFYRTTNINYMGMYNTFAYTKVTGFNFSNLTTVGDQGLALCFTNCRYLNNASAVFPNLTTVSNYGFSGTFNNAVLTGDINFSKVNSVNFDSFRGAFIGSNAHGKIDFSNLTYIGQRTFQNAFTPISGSTGMDGNQSFAVNNEVNFCNVISIGSSGMDSCFGHNTGYTGSLKYNATLNFDSLEYVDGGNCMRRAFAFCNLANVSFPNLTRVNSYTQSGAMEEAFYGASFKTLSMPKLKDLKSTTPMSYCFANNPVLESVEMPSLTNVSSQGMQGILQNCPSLVKANIGGNYPYPYNAIYINVANYGQYSFSSAFLSSGQFEKIIIEGGETNVDSQAFSSAFANSTFVNVGSVELKIGGASGLFSNAFRNSKSLTAFGIGATIMGGSSIGRNSYEANEYANCFRNSPLQSVLVSDIFGIGNNSFRNAFADCNKLGDASLQIYDYGQNITGSNFFLDAFNNSTISQVTLDWAYLPSSTAEDIFGGMLNGVNNCIVYISDGTGDPASLQAMLETFPSFQNNFGGNNISIEWPPEDIPPEDEEPPEE